MASTAVLAGPEPAIAPDECASPLCNETPADPIHDPSWPAPGNGPGYCNTDCYDAASEAQWTEAWTTWPA